MGNCCASENHQTSSSNEPSTYKTFPQPVNNAYTSGSTTIHQAPPIAPIKTENHSLEKKAESPVIISKIEDNEPESGMKRSSNKQLVPRDPPRKQLSTRDLPKGWIVLHEEYYNVITLVSTDQKPLLCIDSYVHQTRIYPTYEDIINTFSYIQNTLIGRLLDILEDINMIELSDEDKSEISSKDKTVLALCIILKYLSKSAYHHFKNNYKPRIELTEPWTTYFQVGSLSPSNEHIPNIMKLIPNELQQNLLNSIYKILVGSSLVSPELDLPVNTIGCEGNYFKECHTIIWQKEDSSKDKCQIIFPGIVVKKDGKFVCGSLVSK